MNFFVRRGTWTPDGLSRGAGRGEGGVALLMREDVRRRDGSDCPSLYSS